jgi:hypothetical protein
MCQAGRFIKVDRGVYALPKRRIRTRLATLRHEFMVPILVMNRPRLPLGTKRVSRRLSTAYQRPSVPPVEMAKSGRMPVTAHDRVLMPSIPTYPLGYLAAKHVVEAGRGAFFGSDSFDLPKRQSQLIAQHDRVPQFGYVGSQFQSCRVLLLGINPGNGPDAQQSVRDEALMSALRSFAERPSPESFRKAQSAYRAVCEFWPVWGQHCSALLTDVGLSIDHIAYSNCLPWRTASQSKFVVSVARSAARLYALPLIKELDPRIIVAVGKRAATILGYSNVDLPPVVTYTREQAAKKSVVRAREEALAQLSALLAANPCESAT